MLLTGAMKFQCSSHEEIVRAVHNVDRLGPEARGHADFQSKTPK